MDAQEKNALTTLLLTGSFVTVGACLAPDASQKLPSPIWIGTLALLFQNMGNLGINLLAGVIQRFQDRVPPKAAEIFQNGQLVDLVGLSIQKVLEYHASECHGSEEAAALRRIAKMAPVHWKSLLLKLDYNEFDRLREQSLPGFLAEVATEKMVPSLPPTVWEDFLVSIANEDRVGLTTPRPILVSAAKRLNQEFGRAFWEILHTHTIPNDAARDKLHSLLLGQNYQTTIEIRKQLTQLTARDGAEHEEILHVVQQIADLLRSFLREQPRQAFTEDSNLAELQAILSKREATRQSIAVAPEESDDCHHYSLVHRIDLLEYKKGHFFSLRRLVGVNLSGKPSSFLIYRETSEVKLPLRAVPVRALYRTNTGLLQEATVKMVGHDNGGRQFRFPFKIFFPKPIQPDESFDVAYSIMLLGELKVLPKVNELMSISLTRLHKGVDRLVFEVFWDFEPRTVNCAEWQDDGRLKAADPATFRFPASLQQADWIERLHEPKRRVTSGATWEIDRPTAAAYIIHYMQ